MYLNCDDPKESAFWVYFSLNFDYLGLKHLVSTHYHDTDPTYRLDLYKNPDGPTDPADAVLTPLEGNGDFRSAESVAILETADVVVTNPPFSLFREYVAQLVEHDKQFLIIGNQNAITYKEVFPLIKDGKMWLGTRSGGMEFRIPESYSGGSSGIRQDETGQWWKKLGYITWFTNLDHKRRHEEQILYRKYDPTLHPKYDNYDAIEVSKVKDIPMDYDGVMGVPITFLGKHNPNQFEIVGSFNAGAAGEEMGATMTPTLIQGKTKLWNGPVINRRPLYKRLVIRKLDQSREDTLRSTQSI